MPQSSFANFLTVLVISISLFLLNYALMRFIVPYFWDIPILATQAWQLALLTMLSSGLCSHVWGKIFEPPASTHLAVPIGDLQVINLPTD